MRGSGYHNLMLRLSSVSEWQTDSPSAVVATARIGRWHPAVAAIRAENRLTSITAPQRQRALRLLQSLAREAEARGYLVAERRQARHRGYNTARDRLAGYLVVDVAPIHCSVGIAQCQDRLPHEPTRQELEKTQREPGTGSRGTTMCRPCGCRSRSTPIADTRRPKRKPEATREVA